MPCLKDAELMRYLDESLPGAAREAVRRHLDNCGRCAGHLQRLAATGIRVDAWLGVLAGPENARPIDSRESLARLRRRIYEPREPVRRWATAVAAAGLLVAAAGIRNHLSVHKVQPVPVEPRPGMADYLPLDGGPMQMGVIVRVILPATAFARFGAAGSGNLQADVLVGEDGIAHAIRLVPQE